MCSTYIFMALFLYHRTRTHILHPLLTCGVPRKIQGSIFWFPCFMLRNKIMKNTKLCRYKGKIIDLNISSFSGVFKHKAPKDNYYQHWFPFVRIRKPLDQSWDHIRISAFKNYVNNVAKDSIEHSHNKHSMWFGCSITSILFYIREYH